MTYKANKILWLNALRVFATFAVVFLHVSGYVLKVIEDTTSFYWWIGNFASASVRWCIPVFVMISGALLLDNINKEGVAEFYEKRLKRILIPLVFWSLFYLVLRMAYKGLTPEQIIISVLTGRPYGHLWYLYMILGLYLFTPFIRLFISSFSEKENNYLILLILILASFYAFVNRFSFLNKANIFTMFIPYLGYYLCGYQLKARYLLTRISARMLVMIIAASYLLIVSFTGLFVHIYGVHVKKGLVFYDYFSPLVIIISIGLFLLFYKIYDNDNLNLKFTEDFINKIAPATLGIYLIHPIILLFSQMILRITPADFNPLLSIPIFSVSVFMICYFTIALIQKIPYLKRIV